MGLGAGDLYIQANCGIIVSDTYNISDKVWYDDATSDKSSNWTGSLPMTYNSNGYYVIDARNGNQSKIMSIPTLNEPCRISMDIKFPLTVNVQGYIGVVDNNGNGKGMRPRRIDNALQCQKITSNAFSNLGTSANWTFSDAWYHMECELTDTTITVKGYDMNNNLLGSKTESYSASYSYTKVILALLTSNNSSRYYFYIKNMGVEPL